jgi:cysteinyl-tRNA synthetase
MDIKIYNTRSRSIETFSPIKKGELSMYSCGPTVYNTPHIGNYRTFVLSDLIRRVFEYNGYAVTQVMNITDVDDKTIRASREEHITRNELAQKYEKLFLEGLASLNVEKPTQMLRATEHIQEMIALIGQLLEKGAAYKAEDGIYMSIAKVHEYGALAHIHISDHVQERVANDEYDKENPRDFALWKFKTVDDGDSFWPAPFGEGRPGWHIECSAMSMKALGPTFDIHSGAIDLVFPHHVNEIAQSETATGKQFVHYWMHGAFVNMTDEKMSKSKGNVIKLETLADQSISPLSYRYWLLTAHYRSPIDFSFDAVSAAQTALIRLLAHVAEYPEGGTVIPEYRDKFQAAINNDLDMPKAVATTWDLVKDSGHTPENKRVTLLDFDRVLGLNLSAVPKAAPIAKLAANEIPPEIQVLVDARNAAREKKDWKKADALRAEIESRGYTIKDTTAGTDIFTE